MSMEQKATDSINAHGDPLAFQLRYGRGRPGFLDGGRDVIKVEARQMAGHQKEAVVTEGAEGSAWRSTSDEGTHLRGTDLAQFPLGFFNAGMQSDLYGRMRALADCRGLGLDKVEIRVANHYWLTGSFIHGTGEGHAEAPDIHVSVQSSASIEAIKSLVATAMDMSPAIGFLRASLPGNTFALYINGRRRQVAGVSNSPEAKPTIPIGSMHARRALSIQMPGAISSKNRPRRAGHCRTGLGDSHKQAHPQYSWRGSVARPGWYV